MGEEDAEQRKRRNDMCLHGACRIPAHINLAVSAHPTEARTRAAFSSAASRMKADFFTPESSAALSIMSAPDWGHLKERFALGSLESLGLPARSSTRRPFQVPSSHSFARASISYSLSMYPFASSYSAIVNASSRSQSRRVSAWIEGCSRGI